MLNFFEITKKSTLFRGIGLYFKTYFQEIHSNPKHRGCLIASLNAELHFLHKCQHSDANQDFSSFSYSWRTCVQSVGFSLDSVLISQSCPSSSPVGKCLQIRAAFTIGHKTGTF